MLEGGALSRKGAGDAGRGQVRCRGGSRVCKREAGSASPRREGCTVAAETGKPEGSPENRCILHSGLKNADELLRNTDTFFH